LLSKFIVGSHTAVELEVINVKVIILRVDHVRESKVVRYGWSWSRGVVEDMGAEVDELGDSVKVWQVIHVQIPLKRYRVFVCGSDFDSVVLSIGHLW